MRVLMVEDEPGIAQFIQQGLTEAGYTVDMAWDGAESLDYALAAEYDIIIVLDITILRLADLEMDTARREVRRAGTLIECSAREFALAPKII